MISNDVSLLEELLSYFAQKGLQNKELKGLPQQGVHHSNKTIVFLFEDFEHDVSVGEHLSALRIEPLNQSAPLLNESIPILSIQYKDLNLRSVEQIVNQGASNEHLAPFRNNLIWRKKGRTRLENVFKLFAKTKKSTFLYYLQVDKSLFSKLNKCLEYVTIFVYVRIEGIQIQPDQNDSERVGWTHVSELHGSEIKSSSGSTVLIPLELKTASGQACYVNGISKEKLLLQSSSTFNNLTFNFGIAFNKALAKVSGVQEGFTPMEKLCELESLNDLLCLVANHTESNYGQDFLGAKSSFNSLFLPKNDKIRVKESFNADLIIELLKFSGQNEMKKLEEELLDFLTTKPIAWFTVNILQKLYFTSRNIERLEELTAFALTEMSRLSSETLTGCVYFKKLPQKDSISLLLAVLEWK